MVSYECPSHSVQCYAVYFRIVALDVTEVDTRATPSLVSIDLSLVRGGRFTLQQEVEYSVSVI